MVAYGSFLLLGIYAFLSMELPTVTADCPLDLSASNFTLAASICSNKDDRGKCCRYINAFVSVSIARYANLTGILGVPLNLTNICIRSISQTMYLYGVPHNATALCGFGTKIPVNYECVGQNTVAQMLQLPKFIDVMQNCKIPLSAESNCRECLNAGIVYLHHLVGTDDNVTLSTCRDATFVALASQVDDASAASFASCFFQVQGLNIPAVSEPSPSTLAPQASPSPPLAAGPSQLTLGVSNNGNHHSYHLTLVPGVGIAVAGVAISMLIVLVVLIRRKTRDLVETENIDKTHSKAFPYPRPTKKVQAIGRQKRQQITLIRSLDKEDLVLFTKLNLAMA